MFSPQRVWPGGSLSSQKRGTRSGSGPDSNGLNLRGDETNRKGKSVTLGETLNPVSGAFIQNGICYEDSEVLAAKASKLEKELYEYQYNMGLLLLEKNEWTSKYEELKEALEEVNDTLKREQSSHLIAISEVEQREESLRKALGVEKQCVADLEKMLREVRSENAEIKFTAESKLNEFKALEAKVEEKSLQVEAKLRASDARLAEINRKSSEIERKLQEIESHETALQRERRSLMAEQQAHDATLSKQREDFRDWERRLQEREERLGKSQMLIRQREERANEIDRAVKQKENEFEEVQEKIDAANIALKKKEDDMQSRLRNLSLREQEYDALRKSLEQKENELQAYEEKLNNREQVEIQKLLDEHNSILDAKKHEFDLEMEEKKKSFDESIKNKLSELERKEAEVKHMEEKVEKRERAVETKWEKLKGKEKEIDLKMKGLNEKEKALKSEGKALETEKKKILSDEEDLKRLKAEVENIKAENEAQISKLHEERDCLTVTKEERAEHHRLQLELKEQIERCRLQEEYLLKESKDLKMEKEDFEKDWEELDEKRETIEKEWKNVNDQREKLERHSLLEEEKLQKEKKETDEYIKREMAALEVAKESFAATMEHERSLMAERAASERSQLLHDIEMHRRKLETEIWTSQEEKEKDFKAREKIFEEEKERDIGNINYLREVARREMEEMKLERGKIEKEKQEIDASKRQLEEQQVGIRMDIDDLVVLTKKLKDQRELFINEKERFVTFVDNHKTCKRCAEITAEFVRSDLQLREIDAEVPNVPERADNYVNKVCPGNVMASGSQNNEITTSHMVSGSPISGTMSWLRRCTSKILKLSPIKKMENAEDLTLETYPVDEQGHREQVGNLTKEAYLMGERHPLGGQSCREPSFKKLEVNGNEAERATANDSSDVEKAQNSVGFHPSAGTANRADEVAEDSQQSGLNRGHQPLKRGRARINRTRSVKAVVEDAKAFLGKGTEHDKAEIPDATIEDSCNLHSENQEELIIGGRGAFRKGRKRNRGQSSNATPNENDAFESEGPSDSVTGGGRRGKRRQKAVQAIQHPTESRYNFRHRRKGVAVTKTSSKEVDEIGETEDAGKAGLTSSVDVMSNNGGSEHLMRCENVAYSQSTKAGATKRLDDNDTLSEELSGTPQEMGTSHDVKEHTSSHGNDVKPEEDDEYEDEPEHPGEVSIGKKLWTFFTT